MKLIILDRDGVINTDSDAYIKHPDEWIPIPGSLEAIARLNHAGHYVAVVTNQSGLSRGLFDLNTLDAIHQKMSDELAALGGHIDSLLFCPHGPADNCSCRKPRPGMMHTLADRLQVDLTDIPLIGDSLRDLQAAVSVKAQPMLVLTGNGTKTVSQLGDLGDVPVYPDLAAAANYLLLNA